MEAAVRRVLVAVVLALAGGVVCWLCASTPGPTGVAVRGLESFDSLMLRRLEATKTPGGALAVARNGRLIFARGYGWADVEAGQAVQPDSLFRIASVSKVFTAVAILKLVEEGRLALEDKAFRILSQIKPPPGADMDPRIGSITVAHLLNHSAGWDQRITRQDAAMEPLAGIVAKSLGVPAPVSSQAMIRYALGRPLDFDPGAKSVYSNFGFVVLGRIIEAVSGQSYEQYVRKNLMDPLNINRMRLGRSLPSGRAPGEVRYYTDSPGVASVFPHLRGSVPLPYGGINLEGIDSSGGWLATPTDLVRFVTALDGSGALRLLKPGTVELMTRSPRPAPPRQWSEALGWAVTNESGGLGWMKLGSTGGDWTYLRRRPDGLVVAASFNKPGDRSLDEEVANAVEQVRNWPAHDLFPR